ncbi:MAG: hypothetical protein VX278_19200 [Myxococcota bacterium]|nr:hypothetical protein [Myxococcota bacterium]
MNKHLHPDDRYLVDASTQFRDYILMPYRPAASSIGKLHSQSLFFHVLRALDCSSLIQPICRRLQEVLGTDQTVWGLKYGPQGWSIEWYFYNFLENNAENLSQATRISDALRDIIQIPGDVPESIPYFMCSFEIVARQAQAGIAQPWRIYTRTGDKHRKESGFSYRVERDLIMENHYWFYTAKNREDLADVIYRLQNSFRAGDRRYHKILLPKQLRPCHTICYAVKPLSDGLYFSRIHTDQVIWFFKHHWKHELGKVFEHNREEFEHLRWDLGIDFCAPTPTTRARINKFGIYGVL